MGSKSIMQKGDKRCFLCGRVVGLERHHVMTGSNRSLAEKHGLCICVVKPATEGRMAYTKIGSWQTA